MLASDTPPRGAVLGSCYASCAPRVANMPKEPLLCGGGHYRSQIHRSWGLGGPHGRWLLATLGVAGVGPSTAGCFGCGQQHSLVSRLDAAHERRRVLEVVVW